MGNKTCGRCGNDQGGVAVSYDQYDYLCEDCITDLDVENVNKAVCKAMENPFECFARQAAPFRY